MDWIETSIKMNLRSFDTASVTYLRTVKLEFNLIHLLNTMLSNNSDVPFCIMSCKVANFDQGTIIFVERTLTYSSIIEI